MQVAISGNNTSTPHQAPDWLIVIAAGTGGPQAFAQLLPQFPPQLSATIIIAQQIRPGFTRVLANQFSSTCSLRTYEPTDGQILRSSEILFVPATCSLSLDADQLQAHDRYLITLDDVSNDIESLRNRTNTIFESVAHSYGRKSIGVLLTGMGNDGCDGMRAIAEAGGITLAQDDATSVVHDLPASAINAGIAQKVLPLWNMADYITALVGGKDDAAAA